MFSFLNFLSEEVSKKDFPSEIFGELSVEKKSENSKTAIFVVRSNDRLDDRDEILRNLDQAGIKAEVRNKTGQSVDPIFIDSHFDVKVILLIKPKSGGMGETTLNASITELFPLIAWEKNYRMGTSIDKFYDFLLEQEPTTLKCVLGKDSKAAVDTIQKASESSKFSEKMLNAMGVYKYLVDENKGKPIKNVYWGYRAKPTGVPKGHPGDIFLEFSDGMLGVSLKAGGKKTKEPKLNTYVNPIFTAFKKERNVIALRRKLHTEVYSKIEGMPPSGSYDKSKKRDTSKLLIKLNKEDKARYEKLYDQHLEICRQSVIDLFNQNKENTLEYIRSAILRDAPSVPTKVIKAVEDNFEEVTETDELGVFLPLVKFVKAYASKSSKQNWFLELKSREQTITMAMSIRTNKSGTAGNKKLGQFFNLSVKYNSLSTE
jgi:vacuolar-type H+-ATPase subunit E/Vma4